MTKEQREIKNKLETQLIRIGRNPQTINIGNAINSIQTVLTNCANNGTPITPEAGINNYIKRFMI